MHAEKYPMYDAEIPIGFVAEKEMRRRRTV
jgi:hypothetical protein